MQKPWVLISFYQLFKTTDIQRVIDLYDIDEKDYKEILASEKKVVQRWAMLSDTISKKGGIYEKYRFIDYIAVDLIESLIDGYNSPGLKNIKYNLVYGGGTDIPSGAVLHFTDWRKSYSDKKKDLKEILDYLQLDSTDSRINEYDEELDV